MPNLPLAFAELLIGGVILEAAIKGDSLANVVKGTATANPISGLGGDTAAGSGSGAVTTSTLGFTNATGSAQKALTLAQALTPSKYNQGNHAGAINQTIAQVKQLGTDCSGYVSDLLGPNGLGIWKTALATPGIPTGPNILPGKGSQITLWNNPAAGNAGHVWVEFDLPGGVKRFFEDAGGVGAHEMSAGQAAQYQATGSYKPLHPKGF